ncbi:ATP-dependent Clp protease proteolytic subunit [Candidatus Saccharibacteria bacterium]|nr:ATP-dependent Clp protease proteolytic subunit [Candidatus Saccharibacteria bacterium]
MSGMLATIPAKFKVNIGTDLEEFERLRGVGDRRLYLYGMIESIDYEERGLCTSVSMTSRLVESILWINREDAGLSPEEREPIRLYINSPGGELIEGFALVEAIELSKTPIYTINVGQWCSMAFLIGITGHKRFSLPNMTFLLHDGNSGVFGSTNKVQDRLKFEERFNNAVVKTHVLKHSKMTEESYIAHERDEFYMLAEDALRLGFIDEIVTDIDAIL